MTKKPKTKKYKSKTINREYMTKSADGIRFRRTCNRRDLKCSANWYLNFNIRSEECILTCNNKCSHYHNEQPGKNLKYTTVNLPFK